LAVPIDGTWLTGKSNPYPRSGGTDAFAGNFGSRGANENSTNAIGIR
jgi:hypothetical protein